MSLERRVAKQLQKRKEARGDGYAAGLEAALEVVENEPEPGEPTIDQYVELEEAGVVAVGNAATRTAKKSIAKAIRALDKEER